MKVTSLLTRLRQDPEQAATSLLELIADLQELDIIEELRFPMTDDSLDTMHQVFDVCAKGIERTCQDLEPWSLDTENLEGIRVRVGEGQFFMLRKSLHDPIISLQLEALDRDQAQTLIVDPLMALLESDEPIKSSLDLNILRNF
uniref:Uncharacterized protein n=1 Tax=Entomoneis paludosa TaxID=265537 RepID=A0A7S3DUA4_9STRA